VVLIVTTFSCITARAQTEPGATDKRIFEEIREHQQLSINIEYLSDMIGPRLTGSEQLKAAEQWTSELARKYGLEDVHLEGWSVAHSWKRGTAEAQIIQPVSRRLTVVSAAWSPSTQGLVRGKVVYVAATNHEELQAYHGKLRGAIVVLAKPSELMAKQRPEDPFVGPSIQTPLSAAKHGDVAEGPPFFIERRTFLKDEGVAAVLYDSGRHYGLLSVAYVADNFDASKVAPTAMLTHEDYSLIWRLLQRGSVEMEIALNNSFSQSAVEAHNVMGEIRGSERPDEMVIICAHLDSWDLASGTTDDGAGVVAVLEAMRALKALGLQPKRTIRFVLFGGEEEGHIGSDAYVKQHREELPKISAVLADDMGTSRVLSLRLHQNYAARGTVDATLSPMSELGLVQPWMERMYGSDYASFNAVGVPGFSTFGPPPSWWDSDQVQHTQADTFDNADQDGMIHQAEVLAGWAWNTAQLPELVPRTPETK
jgi:Zn-dependent M28 family amino/carboxypeptidase